MEKINNKLSFSDIKIGMKFYSFKDEDEYEIFYVTRTYTTDGVNIITISDLNEKDIIGFKSIDIKYDDYINSDKYILIDEYSIIKLQIYKIKHADTLRINAVDKDNNPISYYNSTVKFSKTNLPIEQEKVDCEIALYPFTQKDTMNKICYNLFIRLLLSRNMFDYSLKDQILNIIKKDDAIFTLLWNYNIFDNTPVNYLIGNKMTLKEYTIEYPDNVIPKEYMDYIIKNSNITKAVTNYQIFVYDESIDLSNIKYDYLIIYSVNDDVFYLMLYSTGESLYKLNYENEDQDTKDLIDFMLRKK